MPQPAAGPISPELESLAERLGASPDYRVLRRLKPLDFTTQAPAVGPVKRALLLDVETTGLSYATDSIIELGMILFTYDASTGRVVQVLAAESWLQDPGRPIPENIAKLTGLSDDDVRGQYIDEERVRELATDVGLIIAHNAAFDRPFVDRRLPFLSEIHWGCSMNDVPWQAMHMPSLKLEFLLYTHANTFQDTHHRALDDCRATLHILSTPFVDATLPLKHLRESCAKPRVRIAATRSHFDTKDALRQRGYTWNGDNGKPPKTWCKEILQAELELELQWMRDQIYATHPGQPTTEPVNLRKRYSAS